MPSDRARRVSMPPPPPPQDADARDGPSLSVCPMLAAVGVIGTEWRLAIIHRLLDGPQRFSEILKSNPRLNAKTLSATLKFLEGQGVVQRSVVSTRPFSVVYALTEMGLGLAPAARELRTWGERWLLPKVSDRSRTAPRSPVIQAELPRLTRPEVEPLRAR
ncbi:MAG: winged helix-turn-helix transcriptional regulator [Thermoplasmata archaeon]